MRNGVGTLSASDGSAVLTIAALMSRRFQSGWAWRTSAAAPALCGEAIEVPEMIVAAVAGPDAVDMIDTPGAGDVRLERAVTHRGPPELKLAKPVKFGFGSGSPTGWPWCRRRGEQLAPIAGGRRLVAADADERNRDVERLAGVGVRRDLALERR